MPTRRLAVLRFALSATAVIVLVAALAFIPPVGESAEAGKPEIVRVGLAHLAELAGRSRANMQMKITWCGEQTKPIRTIVLGSFGNRLFVEKYASLRRPGWHYGNDYPGSVSYHQIDADAWTRVLAGLREQVEPERVNAEEPEPSERFHVIVAWTGYLENEVRCADFYTDADAPELRRAVAEAIGAEHPSAELFEARLFRGF